MNKNLKNIKFQAVKNSKRFEDGSYKENLYKNAIENALKKIAGNTEVFIYKYPHVSVNDIYLPEVNKLWTAAFFPGIAYLAFDLTGDKKYMLHSEDYLECFNWRLEKGHTVTHDLGFLYTLSCVANYKLTQNENAKNIALKAADILCSRYNEKGGYIQAWGAMGIKYPDVKIIIDTMLNLPLLFWASEVTGNKKYYEIALNHAITASQYLIRDDASTYHTYLMDPDTGNAVEGKTHQGRYDESTWARGEAWAVYGFALSYKYTKKQYFLDASIKTANYFLNNLPDDFIPFWDFTFNDEEQDIRDSSAASIFLCGLLELSKYVDDPEKELYLKAAYKIIESLYINYSTKDDHESNGLLLHGMYHRNSGADECTIWGDYFYFEALVRLLKSWELYW